MGLLQAGTATQQSNPQPNASQPDQEKYDLVAGLMVKHVYDKADAILDSLQRGQDIVQSIGTIISQLMMFSIKVAEQNQQTIEPRMLFQAAVETARAVGDLMLDRELVPPEQEAQITEQGFYAALDVFGQRATLTDEERSEYVVVMDEFQSMGGQPNGTA